MTLRAWFDPKPPTADMRQFLAERRVLGVWRFERINQIPQREVYGHFEDLSLPDGSILRVSATCDRSLAPPSTTLGVLSGADALLLLTAGGTNAVSAMVATGTGGFLSLEISFNHDESIIKPA